jgi:hypothetical protein
LTTNRSKKKPLLKRRVFWELIGTLIAAGAVVLAAVISSRHPMIQPGRVEQAASAGGVPVFRSYDPVVGTNHRIPYLSYVRVSCKLHDPTIKSDLAGYWYRLSSTFPGDYVLAYDFYNGGGTGSASIDFDPRVSSC